MGLFVSGSTVCALATSMPVLVSGRAAQGAGAAALEALSFLVVGELSAGARRGAGQAAISAVMAISFVAGPLVGGLLTDHAGWRWAFLVNVPIGLAAMGLLAVALPPTFGRHESRETPVDVLGTVLLTAAVGSVILGVTRHQQLGTWLAPTTGAAVTLGLVGLAAFVGVERYAEAPVIPVRLLADRVTGRLLLTGAFATTGLYACILLVPRWYQLELGTSATSSGLRVYPLLLAVLVAVNIGAVAVGRGRGRARPARRRVRRDGRRAPRGSPRSTTARRPGCPLVAMGVLGLGMGPALSGLQVALLRVTAPADLGAAMGTLLLGRQLVGVIALAVTEAMYGAALGHGPAAATGQTVAWVAGTGAVVSAAALLGLPRRLPGVPTAAGPGGQSLHLSGEASAQK